MLQYVIKVCEYMTNEIRLIALASKSKAEYIKEAARKDGRSLSNFLLQSAFAKAKEIIAQEEQLFTNGD